jgi:hypothetical protein
VIFPVSLSVSSAEPECVEQEPRYVCWVFVLPLSAGMAGKTFGAIHSTVGFLNENTVCVEGPWGEHLKALHGHFHYQLIRKHPRGKDWIFVDSKNVHGVVWLPNHYTMPLGWYTSAFQLGVGRHAFHFFFYHGF